MPTVPSLILWGELWAVYCTVCLLYSKSIKCRGYPTSIIVIQSLSWETWAPAQWGRVDKRPPWKELRWAMPTLEIPTTTGSWISPTNVDKPTLSQISATLSNSWLGECVGGSVMCDTVNVSVAQWRVTHRVVMLPVFYCKNQFTGTRYT